MPRRSDSMHHREFLPPTTLCLQLPRPRPRSRSPHTGCSHWPTGRRRLPLQHAAPTGHYSSSAPAPPLTCAPPFGPGHGPRASPGHLSAALHPARRRSLGAICFWLRHAPTGEGARMRQPQGRSGWQRRRFALRLVVRKMPVPLGVPRTQHCPHPLRFARGSVRPRRPPNSDPQPGPGAQPSPSGHRGQAARMRHPTPGNRTLL